jgi:polyisoprenyl-phosphate glycosyltransferase
MGIEQTVQIFDDTFATVVIVIPVFNDWESLLKLLHSLDWILALTEIHIEILVVDDASNTPLPSDLLPENFNTIQKIDVL